ncbi:MAG TPA: YtxH domain-containing protein [Anaerolineae bacterium]|nr:YtxH domain-containing protein [Anaerolineae bacterium]
MMNKGLGFMAGLICGALVGATAALLMTPAPGAELRAEARAHWEHSLAEAQKAMEETRAQLEKEYEQSITPGRGANR